MERGDDGRQALGVFHALGFGEQTANRRDAGFVGGGFVHARAEICAELCVTGSVAPGFVASSRMRRRAELVLLLDLVERAHYARWLVRWDLARSLANCRRRTDRNQCTDPDCDRAPADRAPRSSALLSTIGFAGAAGGGAGAGAGAGAERCERGRRDIAATGHERTRGLAVDNVNALSNEGNRRTMNLVQHARAG